MGMYEQDLEMRESEIERQIKTMKTEAYINNDVILYNSIMAYEKDRNNVIVLLETIKMLNEENKELISKKFT